MHEASQSWPAFYQRLQLTGVRPSVQPLLPRRHAPHQKRALVTGLSTIAASSSEARKRSAAVATNIVVLMTDDVSW